MLTPRGRWHPSLAFPPAPALPASFHFGCVFWRQRALSRAVYRVMLCSLSPHLLSHRASIHSSSAFCLSTSLSSSVLLPQAALPLASPYPSSMFPYPGGLLSLTICSPVTHFHSCLLHQCSCHHCSLIFSSFFHLLLPFRLYCLVTLLRHAGAPQCKSPPSISPSSFLHAVFYVPSKHISQQLEV